MYGKAIVFTSCRLLAVLSVNPAARKKPELFSVSLWKKEQGECILLSRNTGRITPTVENYPEKRNVHHAEKN